MTSFSSTTPFDKSNDPDRPKIGERLDDREIVKVETLSTSEELLGAFLGPVPENSENLLVKNHPLRPFVKYLVWVKPATQT